MRCLHIDSTHPGLDEPLHDELLVTPGVVVDSVLRMLWQYLAAEVWSSVTIEHPNGTVCRYTAGEARP